MMTENNQNKRKKSTFGGVFVVVLLTVIIVVGAIFAAKLFSSSPEKAAEEPVSVASTEKKSSDEATTQSNTKTYTQSGKGFPLAFSSNDIADISEIGSGVCVVSNNMLFCVSSSGKMTLSQVLNYSEPVVKTCGNYGLVFDRMSGRFVVFNKKSVIYKGQSPDSQQIITVQISSNGSFAIASRSSKAASLLTFYDKKGNEKFQWACTKEHIVSLAISSDNRSIACAALTSESGEIQTEIYLLNIYSDETVWQHSLKDCAAVNVYFASGSRKIGVLCSDSRLVLDSKASEPVISESKFSSKLLSSHSDRGGYSAVLTSKFGTFNGYELTSFAPDNSVNYTFDTEEKILGVFCAGKRSWLLTTNSIICVNSGGNASKIVSLDSSALGMCVSSGDIYSFSLNNLYKN